MKLLGNIFRFIGLVVLPLFFIQAGFSAEKRVQFKVEAGASFSSPYTESIKIFINQSTLAHSVVYDPGVIVGMSLGYRWAHFLLSLEYFYLRNTLNEAVPAVSVQNASSLMKGYMDSNNLLLNGEYQFTFFKEVIPFIGLGFGLSKTSMYNTLGFQFDNPIVINDHAYSFAFAPFVGLLYQLGKDFRLDIRFWYFVSYPHLHDKFNEPMSLSLQSYIVSIGLVY